jgi:hypothetical protein
MEKTEAFLSDADDGRKRVMQLACSYVLKKLDRVSFSMMQINIINSE